MNSWVRERIAVPRAAFTDLPYKVFLIVNSFYWRACLGSITFAQGAFRARRRLFTTSLCAIAWDAFPSLAPAYFHTLCNFSPDSDPIAGSYGHTLPVCGGVTPYNLHYNLIVPHIHFLHVYFFYLYFVPSYLT